MFERPMFKRIPDGEEEEIQYNSRFPNARSIILATTAAFAFVGALTAIAQTSSSEEALIPSSSLKSLSNDLSIEQLLVSNEYERSSGVSLGDGMYPYTNLVQVQKETVLSLGSGSATSWRVNNMKDGSTIQEVEIADAITVIFPEVGVFLISAYDGAVNFTVTAKIIRYELRSLSDADRDIYFSALHRFYVTPQDEGENLYGNTYMSLTYLLREHLYGAASKDCDHWHDGAGIVNHHVGITWQFENSLRMIDSTTAAHYWDYTIEYYEGTEWYDSIIFADDWFGDNSPSNDMHVITQGRWGYTPVMASARGFSNITNPYGLLRSPWNTNPTPFLMRHNKTSGNFANNNDYFPNCSQFADYIRAGEISFADLSSAINGELHGPVHLMIGGLWGLHAHANVWDELSNWGYESTDSFLLFAKYMWRQGFIRTPEFCTSDVPHADCMPHCPSEITDGVNASAILANTGYSTVTPAVDNLEHALNDLDVSMKLRDKKILEVYCHIGSPGEMFTSAAPQDPTFWPLHGNAERYTQMIRILANKGVITFNNTWGYTHVDSASDTNVICDWDGVTGFDMPTCKKGVCSGHAEMDLLPFSNLIKGQDGLLSNKQFWDVVSPYNEDLPYAYDGLTTWNGCRNRSLVTEAGLKL